MIEWKSSRLRKRNLVRFLTLQLVATFAAGVFLGQFPHHDMPIAAEAILYGIPVSAMLTLVTAVLFPRMNRLPYIPSVLLRALFLVAAVEVGFVIGLWMFGIAQLDARPFDPRVVAFVQTNAWKPNIRYGALFVVTALLVYSAFDQLTRRLGPGTLEALLIGRYHHPRREERIFLFLDMKESTRLAERLGDLKFSALLRDFFRDLTPAIVETGASVAEYVGDEVVLTWPIQKGLYQCRCLGAFVIAKSTIRKRAAWYIQRYGVVPDFKVGLHCGSVVATEVGEVKTEIVYHGDVLNTTARITSLCSELGVDILVSQELADQLPLDVGFHLQALGAHTVKGKDQAVPVSTLETELPTAALIQ